MGDFLRGFFAGNGDYAPFPGIKRQKERRKGKFSASF
jgi:hypothetical protein